MATADRSLKTEQIQEISLLHRKAVGETFTATYRGTRTLHNKDWDVLAVRPTEPLCQILDQIYETANGKAWKGFTSPKDGYVDYWIFGQLDQHAHVTGGGQYTFKIKKSMAFQPSEWMVPGYALKVGFFYEIGLEKKVISFEDLFN